MAERDEWWADGRRHQVIEFSDVGNRDGLGLELEGIAPAPGTVRVAGVFREDAGPLPEISCAVWRPIPPRIRERFLAYAVDHLLAEHLEADRAGRLTSNIADGLGLAGRTVTGWQGPEWPIEEDDDGRAKTFVAPTADATPFAWLQMSMDDQARWITTYQDNTYFGLQFGDVCGFRLVDNDPDYFRLHDDLALPTGTIETVTLTIDTSVMALPHQTAPILTEAVMVIDGGEVVLIAAEPYAPDEWHRYDEAVVVMRDRAALERLPWIPPRAGTAREDASDR